VRLREFWVLFSVFGLTWTAIFIPLVHLVPLARDLGIEPLQAATLVSALGIAAVAGRLAMGWLSDRVGRRAILAVALAAQAASFVALGRAATLPALAAATVLFGLSYGTVSVIFPAMVADLFGRAHAGSLVGLIFGLAGPTAALGPLGAGWIYDRLGSYAVACWISAAVNLTALVLLAFTRAPRAWAESPSIDRAAVAR
jgi:MFS family permease